MSEMYVSIVPKELVSDLWPLVEGYVRRATDYAFGRYAPEDVLDLIMRYDYPLWVAFKGDCIKGFVVTRIVEYPRKRCLFLEFCGGVDGFSWKASMLSMLRSWAKDNNCDSIEGAGRAGWQKVFAHDGYVPMLQHFELPID